MTEVPRRIVTGHDSKGKSIVVSDGPVPNTQDVSGAASFHEIWVTAGAPAPIVAKEEEPTTAGDSVPPPANGTRLRIVDFPPGGRSPMHRTETVDYGIVLAGELQLILDDGSETTLHAGDIVIQRGTDHTWVNASDHVTRVAFFLVDGKFVDDLLATLPGDVAEHLMDRA
jgi:quercetin dioxygenase-like cupin family protein